MSIEEIKDITKLQKRLKSALDELKYIKKCCENAGEELAKHSFYYDHKEKNLVIQALALNEKYERQQEALNEVKEQVKHLYSYMVNQLYHYFDENEKFVIDEYKKDISNIIKQVAEINHDKM